MFVKKLQEYHDFTAFTFQWVITKSMENRCTPLIEASVKMMFFSGDCMIKMFVDFAVTGVKTSITYHFKVLFGDMGD